MYSERMESVQNRISDIISKMDQFSGKERSFSRKTENFTGENKSGEFKLGDVPAENMHFKTAAGTFNEQLEKMIREKSNKYGVSEDLIKAVIKTESNGKPDAVSRTGAVGLMQIMPETARILNVNPEDPEENIDGGVRYLKSMAGKFNSLDEVLAAYNSGPGAVKKYGGIPPYRETKNYIKQVRGYLK